MVWGAEAGGEAVWDASEQRSSKGEEGKDWQGGQGRFLIDVGSAMGVSLGLLGLQRSQCPMSNQVIMVDMQ